MSISGRYPVHRHAAHRSQPCFLTSRYSSHITDNALRVGLNYRWAAR